MFFLKISLIIGIYKHFLQVIHVYQIDKYNKYNKIIIRTNIEKNDLQTESSNKRTF